jgi:hypothetical protein
MMGNGLGKHIGSVRAREHGKTVGVSPCARPGTGAGTGCRGKRGQRHANEPVQAPMPQTVKLIRLHSVREEVITA